MDTRLTFQAVRAHHNISLEQLSAESHCYLQEVRLIDALGQGTPHVIDTLLTSLSRLSGETYTRKNVGGFSFTLQPRDLAQDIEKVSLFFDEHSLRDVNAGQLQSTIEHLQTYIQACNALGKSETIVQQLTQAQQALKRAKGHLKRATRARGFYESIRTAQKLINKALEQWDAEKGNNQDEVC